MLTDWVCKLFYDTPSQLRMSSTASPTSSSLGSEKAQHLASYLQTEFENTAGDLYVKSKFIADDVELSPKEIGALMTQLQRSVPDLEIEKWSYTSATTWRITAEA